jgi:hypothetical protein
VSAEIPDCCATLLRAQERRRRATRPRQLRAACGASAVGSTCGPRSSRGARAALGAAARARARDGGNAGGTRRFGIDVTRVARGSSFPGTRRRPALISSELRLDQPRPCGGFSVALARPLLLHSRKSVG